MTRGGKRPGPGHPVTTGSASTPPVFYRVSASQRRELDKEGKRWGISGNLVAKLRAFPARHPQVEREETKR